MERISFTPDAIALLPTLLMAIAACLPRMQRIATPRLWRTFVALSWIAVAGSVVAVVAARGDGALQPWLHPTTPGLILAIVVQFLGTVIAAFSARYLDGEPGQRSYVQGLALVLAAVQVLLLADHWVVLIASWAFVGMALQRLLCFYAERPFALLAAHKKRIADRLADVLLIAAAGFAWHATDTGSLSGLSAYVAQGGNSWWIEASAVCLVLAVVLRTALLPVHGWLIQVMEAPTPVSALLHAGVVNLGGFVLIRFAPLLEHSAIARGLLLAFGLATAVLAGMVMLTRISIKVRLAWSTAAQMGFMVLECALGLYTLALLHLVGHSLYKAHAFLGAAGAVRETSLRIMHGSSIPQRTSLWLAPVATVSIVLGLQHFAPAATWPWWWSVILGFAWAPMLWLPGDRSGAAACMSWPTLASLLAVVGLTGATMLAHALPLGVVDAPHEQLGWIALAGMILLYLCLVLMRLRPEAIAGWRRWSYAGFYVDEIYTRLALSLWPTAWTARSAAAGESHPGNVSPARSAC